jgi:hypothetical protein
VSISALEKNEQIASMRIKNFGGATAPLCPNGGPPMSDMNTFLNLRYRRTYDTESVECEREDMYQLNDGIVPTLIGQHGMFIST